MSFPLDKLSHFLCWQYEQNHTKQLPSILLAPATIVVSSCISNNYAAAIDYSCIITLPPTVTLFTPLFTPFSNLNSIKLVKSPEKESHLFQSIKQHSTFSWNFQSTPVSHFQSIFKPLTLSNIFQRLVLCIFTCFFMGIVSFQRFFMGEKT